jgi:hypothetical protein
MNLDAMKELLAAVEGGGEIVFGEGGANCRRALTDHWTDCAEAYREDDMNAALALHAALLPGWGYAFTSDSAITGKPCATVYGGGRSYDGEAPSPARALLIATLRGKIAELDAGREDAE